jgi:hypothetical protein
MQVMPLKVWVVICHLELHFRLWVSRRGGVESLERTITSGILINFRAPL